MNAQRCEFDYDYLDLDSFLREDDAFGGIGIEKVDFS